MTRGLFARQRRPCERSQPGASLAAYSRFVQDINHKLMFDVGRVGVQPVFDTEDPLAVGLHDPGV